jgi:exodeoxyribonuclease VII large subunit
MGQRDDEPRILTVSQLTRGVRDLLEGAFPAVWVNGEISNFVAHRSGHWYFTLKDEGASLSAAMFRGQNSRVRFEPEHGMDVICRGRISVYPPRGNYQLIVDRIEPQGVGALQLAFEQLHRRLQAEGLFDPARKRPLPRLPVRIGLVTSPTGAAIRDMLRVLGERFRPLEIRLAPTRVQGAGAAAEIAAALDLLNRDAVVDLILCGRGGGSLEDLWAFNEEEVARAIARSAIPVISAVGHEVDVTIADLVADARAATPSNAAEIAVPVRAELDGTLVDLTRRLGLAAGRELERRRQLSVQLGRRLVDPRRYLQIQAQRKDELSARLGRAQRARMVAARGALAERAARLDTLSPLGVLARGYAIATADGRPLRAANDLSPGDRIEIRLHRGTLGCSVDEVAGEEEDR